MFGVKQPTPLVLAILRGYYAKQIPLKHARRTLAAIEGFHFIFTAVSSQSSSGGISFMYASAARDLSAAHDKVGKIKLLDQLRGKLRERLPELEIFTAGFSALNYLESNTRQKPLVRYVLGRIDAHFRTDAVVDYGAMTIEHLASQSGPPDSSVSADSIGNIGNLIFVSDDLNQRLKNKPFPTKKEMLKESNVPFDPVLKAASTWQDAQIASRVESLAALAYSKIWKF